MDGGDGSFCLLGSFLIVNAHRLIHTLYKRVEEEEEKRGNGDFPGSAHRTHEYSQSVRSINDLLFRRGRAGENGERSSLRYPTAFAVGTVIIKATVAVLLAQKYIFSMALLYSTGSSSLIFFCFQPLLP